MASTYNGYTLVKTGRMAWDWRACFNGRYRWGTLAELRADIDLVASGISLPPARENV